MSNEAKIEKWVTGKWGARKTGVKNSGSRKGAKTQRIGETEAFLFTEVAEGFELPDEPGVHLGAGFRVGGVDGFQGLDDLA